MDPDAATWYEGDPEPEGVGAVRTASGTVFRRNRDGGWCNESHSHLDSLPEGHRGSSWDLLAKYSGPLREVKCSEPPREPDEPREATLYGGPAGGNQIVLRGTEGRPWPEYVCINVGLPPKLQHHYRHISGGVYEHQGVCLEFDHSPLPHVDRCPHCGSEILTKTPHGHRREG